MAFPYVPAAFLGGGLLAQGALNKKYKFTPPSEDIMMSDKDVQSSFQNLLGDLTAVESGKIAGIKQVGAAGRAPIGATQSAIAETGRATAEGARKVLPALKGEQRRSKSEYFRLRHMFEQAEAGQLGAQQDFLQSGLGGLGQILTLWQGGYFNKPGAGGGQMGSGALDQYPYQQPPYDPNQFKGVGT